MTSCVGASWERGRQGAWSRARRQKGETGADSGGAGCPRPVEHGNEVRQEHRRKQGPRLALTTMPTSSCPALSLPAALRH